MPFGKYKGFDLEELEYNYLLWVYQNCDRISPKLRQAIGEELDERGYHGDEEPAAREKKKAEPPPEPEPEPLRKPPSGPGLHLLIAPHQLQLFGDLVDVGYKGLAKRCHPDAGGTTEGMRELNAMVADLRRGVASALGGKKAGAA